MPRPLGTEPELIYKAQDEEGLGKVLEHAQGVMDISHRLQMGANPAGQHRGEKGGAKSLPKLLQPWDVLLYTHTHQNYSHDKKTTKTPLLVCFKGVGLMSPR